MCLIADNIHIAENAVHWESFVVKKFMAKVEGVVMRHNYNFGHNLKGSLFAEVYFLMHRHPHTTL